MGKWVKQTGIYLPEGINGSTYNSIFEPLVDPAQVSKLTGIPGREDFDNVVKHVDPILLEYYTDGGVNIGFHYGEVYVSGRWHLPPGLTGWGHNALAPIGKSDYVWLYRYKKTISGTSLMVGISLSLVIVAGVYAMTK